MTAEHKPLSPGERAVWAAEFVRAMGDGQKADDAAKNASACVWVLQDLGGVLTPEDGAVSHRRMLEDMLGHQGELICADGRTAGFAASPDACVLCGRPAAYHRSRR